MIKNTLTKIGDYKAEYNNKLGLKLPLLGIYQEDCTNILPIDTLIVCNT